MAGLRSAADVRAGQPLSEINVTPFVDVMLVLLVIFMVTAPLLAVGVPVDIPESKAQNISRPDKPLVVSVRANGEVYLQETKIELASLVAKLRYLCGNIIQLNNQIFWRRPSDCFY